MSRASLSRRIGFAAAHRYRRPDWTNEKNESVFGLCARESFHGHTYVCEVTISGVIDPETGFVIDLGVFDSILNEEVKSRFDHRNINLDVPEFADGKLIPSGENIARFVFTKVGARLPEGVELENVTIAEDQTLSASYSGE